jgi:hypothetical protein
MPAPGEGSLSCSVHMSFIARKGKCEGDWNWITRIQPEEKPMKMKNGH